MKLLFRAIALFFTFIFLLPAYPQSLSLRFSGYAKNLTIHSTSILENDAYLLNLSRFRAQGIADLGTSVHAEIWLDNELLAGDFLTTADFELSRTFERPTFFDLDWTIAENERSRFQQAIFRAFATVYAGPAELTLGRQRIAWGTGFVWNPTDLLNPFNPTAIELEEKAGVDAVHGVLPIGVLSRIEAAFAPGRNELDPSFAARASSNFEGYDWSLMMGSFQNDNVVGGDFAGYISGAGFRGEFAYTLAEDDKDYLRAILNVDYNFANGLYFFVEAYYNGQGKTDKTEYEFTDLLSGRSFNLAQHYVAVSATKDITPLFRASVYSILNLNDNSSLLGPTLTYSLATNLELAASVYFFIGPQGSEYGALKNSYFAYLQYYF